MAGYWTAASLFEILSLLFENTIEDTTTAPLSLFVKLSYIQSATVSNVRFFAYEVI